MGQADQQEAGEGRTEGVLPLSGLIRPHGFPGDARSVGARQRLPWDCGQRGAVPPDLLSLSLFFFSSPPQSSFPAPDLKNKIKKLCRLLPQAPFWGELRLRKV